MTAPSRDATRVLLAEILNRVVGIHKRVAAIEDCARSTEPRRGETFPERVGCAATALAFCDAAAMNTTTCLWRPSSHLTNQRLAKIFRSGNVSGIASEPELTGAAEVLELAADYFAITATRNGSPAAGTQLTADLRNHLADEIAMGLRPELKPAFKIEYIRFKRECAARSQLQG